MANQIKVTATTANTTKIPEFQHVITQAWQDGALNSTTGQYETVFGNVPAGDYANLTVNGRLKGTAQVFSYLAQLLSVAGAGGVYGFTEADKTLGRVDRSVMSLVSVGNVTDLTNLLAQDLTNKRLQLQDGDYVGSFNQTGAWNNVEVASDSGNARLLSTASSVNWLFQGSKARSRISLQGFKLQSDKSGTGYPQLWWNELGTYDGLEFAHLDITGPNGAFNGMGCTQYSTSSNSGQVARNIWMHHLNLHDIGRVGIELLSQGYDGVFRLFNLIVEDNTFDNMGLHDGYGMATSFSGLFRQISLANNNAMRTRKIAYEFVNNQQVVARNNNCSNGTDGVGYGISDDGHGLTDTVYIEGGIIEAKERPFYIYDSKNVHIDGQGQTWKGHRGVDMNAQNCSFKNLTTQIHTNQTGGEASWQFGGTSSGNTMDDCTVTSAGATAAGYYPGYESIVLRSGTHDNRLTNVTTIMGKRANGTTFATPTGGGDGHIVDQGSAGTNVITNNSFSTAA